MKNATVYFLAAIGLLIAGCGGKPGAGSEGGNAVPGEQSDSGSVRVVADTVKPMPFEDWGRYSADLRGIRDVTLTSGQGGRVINVSEVGTRVKEGQGLCDIESEKYRAMYLQAQSALELAKGELERSKANIEKGYVGAAAKDKADLDFQSARVALLQSQMAYQDSRCQAPFSGVLVSRNIEKFQTVAPGQPTVRIAQTDKLEAIIAIPESESFDYRDGQTAEFSLIQDTTQVFQGKIRSIDKAVESRNRTVTARLEIENRDGKLRPGMVGRARILRAKLDSAIVVPSDAVLRLQEGPSVMVIREGRAVRVPIELGPATGKSVMIRSGLNAGDVLITSGAFQVTDGTLVSYR